MNLKSPRWSVNAQGEVCTRGNSICFLLTRRSSTYQFSFKAWRTTYNNFYKENATQKRTMDRQGQERTKGKLIFSFLFQFLFFILISIWYFQCLNVSMLILIICLFHFFSPFFLFFIQSYSLYYYFRRCLPKT